MAHDDLRQCPYCAEFISRDAMKCRFCGSSLTTEQKPSQEAHWTRPVHERALFGVCTGIARELNMPQLVIPLRLFFILTTLFWGFGPIFYIVLLFLMPAEHPSTATPSVVPATPSKPARSPQDSNYSLLYAVIILAAMGVMLLLLTTGIPDIPSLFRYVRFPSMLAPHNFLFDILPHGHFDWFPLPNPVVLLLALFVAIVLFSAFKLFRPALGCIGAVMLGIVFFVIVLPLLPVLIVPLTFITFAFVVFGIFALMVRILTELLG